MGNDDNLSIRSGQPSYHPWYNLPLSGRVSPPATPPHEDDSADTGPTTLSPAAQFLAAFSPPTPHSLPPATSFPSPDLFTFPDSPAARYLSSYATPPPSKIQPLTESHGYHLGRLLGSGAFAEVRLATSNTNPDAVLAVKVVRRSRLNTAAASRLENEEKIWTRLNHEHILPLIFSHHSPDTSLFFMLFCPDGNLLEMLSRERVRGTGRRGLEPDVVRSIFRQVVSGVRYLHETMKIVHRDLKLENILIDDMGAPRIADFGFAYQLSDTSSTEQTTLEEENSTPFTSTTHLSLRRPQGQARPNRPRHASNALPRRRSPSPDESSFVPGSLPYAAPELLMPKRSSSRRPSEVRPAQDIWALGCILHALLTGLLPFMDSFEPRLQMKIISGTWEVDSPASEQDKSILRGCLCGTVEDRWEAARLDENVHMIGAAQYQRIHRQRMASSRSRSGVRYAIPEMTEIPSSDFSGPDGELTPIVEPVSVGSRRSRSTSKSRTGAVPIPRPYPRTRFVSREEDISDIGAEPFDHDTRRSWRALSSESRSGSHAGSEDAILTPPDGGDILAFGLHRRRGRRSASAGGSASGSGGWDYRGSTRSSATSPGPSSGQSISFADRSRSRSRGRAPVKYSVEGLATTGPSLNINAGRGKEQSNPRQGDVFDASLQPLSPSTSMFGQHTNVRPTSVGYRRSRSLGFSLIPED